MKMMEESAKNFRKELKDDLANVADKHRKQLIKVKVRKLLHAQTLMC
jgi:hypothetical protein